MRLREGGSTSCSDVFRSYVRHGRYAWKEYTLLKTDGDNYSIFVRNIHDAVKDFLSDSQARLSQAAPDAVF